MRRPNVKIWKGLHRSWSFPLFVRGIVGVVKLASVRYCVKICCLKKRRCVLKLRSLVFPIHVCLTLLTFCVAWCYGFYYGFLCSQNPGIFLGIGISFWLGAFLALLCKISFVPYRRIFRLLLVFLTLFLYVLGSNFFFYGTLRLNDLTTGWVIQRVVEFTLVAIMLLCCAVVQKWPYCACPRSLDDCACPEVLDGCACPDSLFDVESVGFEDKTGKD